MCVSGGKKFLFFEKFRMLFSWETRFEIHPFTYYQRIRWSLGYNYFNKNDKNVEGIIGITHENGI